MCCVLLTEMPGTGSCRRHEATTRTKRRRCEGAREEGRGRGETGETPCGSTSRGDIACWLRRGLTHGEVFPLQRLWMFCNVFRPSNMNTEIGAAFISWNVSLTQILFR